MTVRINTNAMALNTHRNVVNNSKAQAKNLEKLSSGLKINRAADAPAALNISEQMRAQTASLKQAIDNTEMSVSLMQTAEAALDEVSRSLISARQLAVHAANTGTNDEFMHTADQQEIESILTEINTIAANTSTERIFSWTAAGPAMVLPLVRTLSFWMLIIVQRVRVPVAMRLQYQEQQPVLK